MGEADILGRIAAYKRQDVAQRRTQTSPSELESRIKAVGAPRGFAQALSQAARPGSLALIAEIKRASPSKGLIREAFEPADLARAYARGGAACLSVLTDGPSFQGDDAYLVAARDATPLPAIRKDFMVDPWQVAESRALGADAILVILAMVDDSLAADLMSEARRWGMDVLVETHDEVEFARAEALDAKLIGINNRDLRTFHTDLAVSERLLQGRTSSALIVTESGITGPGDVRRLSQAGAHAMLVGESLMRQADVEAATRALLA
ncbi:MAG: indole-3-glycerol phosphate synthase TrpC [Alphaproteobacteria bacterium]|nr:indole-3-glycerol phosphate synthase TrpC [Alphaproteobacteria bacterium]